jgi:outer membrane protein assembly factor BamB
MAPCVIAGLLSAAIAARASDWPGWRGPDGNGASPEKGLMATWPPEELWSASVGVGFSSVVVAGGRAFVMGHRKGDGGHGTDTLYCLDAASGAETWKYEYDCLTLKKDDKASYAGPRSTPAVDGGLVYAVSLEGRLFCLDAETGKEVWSKDLEKYSKRDKPLDYGYCASPVVFEDVLLCHINEAAMAFDKATGKPRWRCQGGKSSWNGTAPVICRTGGPALVLFGEGELVCADVETGKRLWKYDPGRTIVATPVVVDGSVLYSTYPNKGACGLLRVTPEGPDALWKTTALRAYQVGNPVVWNGHAYGIDCARTEFSYSDARVSSLKCVDLENGSTTWVQKGVGWAQVILADGKLLVQREEGELVVAEASPEGYTELGRAKVIEGPCWAVPALADGKVYCRNNDGKVVCVRVGPK